MNHHCRLSSEAVWDTTYTTFSYLASHILRICCEYVANMLDHLLVDSVDLTLMIWISRELATSYNILQLHIPSQLLARH
jgi:hypothetical protein